MMGPGGSSIRKAYRQNLVVLVVEDHLLFSKGMKHALAQHTMVLARSLEEARTRYHECLPDLIFLDIDLPDGTGFELLDDIRADEPDAYIVMLTGSKLKEDVLISQQKNVQGYIIKPFTKDRIEQVIEDYFRHREEHIKLLLVQTEKNRKEATASPEQES